MPNNSIPSLKRDSFSSLLRAGRVHLALRLLRQLSESKLMWEVTDDINRIDTTYKFMLQYVLSGAEDPRRSDIYEDIIEELQQLYDRVERRLATAESSDVYSTTMRQCAKRTASDAIDACLAGYAASDAFSQALNPDAPKPSPLEREANETAVFDTLWTSFPYTKDTAAAASRLLNAPEAPDHVKSLALSAISLGLMAWYDTRRVELLADAYTSGLSDRLALQALTGLLLGMSRHRNRLLSRSTLHRLEALRDTDHWKKDVKAVFLELIRTRDTERITRKMQDDIAPEIMRIKKKFDRLGGKTFTEVDLSDPEENPEWQELLEKSGLADKMKELSELQEEGADVMMGTFGHLKSFPFFYTVANWFLPFNTEHSVVAELGQESAVIGSLINASPFMCDNDKYSFILAVNKVPQSQRDMMLSQLRQQNVSEAEIQGASLNLPAASRANIVNKYVQNLYRFFRLFRRKEDFVDPFASDTDLMLIEWLGDSIDDALPIVSEFYFKHGYYEDALAKFAACESRHLGPSEQLYQKMGFCEQHLGHLEEALKYYEQAELLDARSIWTLRRLASVQRQLGRYEEALKSYRRLDAAEPDKPSTVLNIARCLLSLKRYDEAVDEFYRADWLDEGRGRADRPLAWALLMAGQRDKAAEAYGRLLAADHVQADDWLNAGHLALAQGDITTTIQRYTAYVRHPDGKRVPLPKAIEADKEDLAALGVDIDKLPLIIDAVSYNLNA